MGGKKYDPLVVRFFILQSHYRSTLDFSTEAVEGAAKGLEKLLNTVRNIRTETRKKAGPVPGGAALSIALDDYRKAFLEAMDDDFNTPQAIAVLFDVGREVNSFLTSGNGNPQQLEEIDRFFAELGGTILGIVPAQIEQQLPTHSILEDDLIELVVELRNEVRAQKLWALSDEIRERLTHLGVALEDKKEGTSWHRTNVS